MSFSFLFFFTNYEKYHRESTGSDTLGVFFNSLIYSLRKMVLKFGNLPIHIRRVVYYSLSPLEQRAWAKSITHGIPNWLRRISRALPPMLPGAYLNILLIINATYTLLKLNKLNKYYNIINFLNCIYIYKYKIYKFLDVCELNCKIFS